MDDEWEQLKAAWSAEAEADEARERAEAWMAHARKKRAASRRAVLIEITAGVLVVGFYAYELTHEPHPIGVALAAATGVFLVVYYGLMWRIARQTGELAQSVEAHLEWLRRQLDGERRWFAALRWMSLCFTAACILIILWSVQRYEFNKPELAYPVIAFLIASNGVMWWHCKRKMRQAQAALERMRSDE